MKKYNIISAFLLVIFMLTGTSCEEFLDKTPNGVLSTSNFYQTEQDAEAAVNAAYTILLDFWVSNIAFEKDIISDDAVKGQGIDLAALTNMDNLNFNPGDGVVQSIWAIYYKGIYNCNLVLDHVPDIDMDVDKKERILGEAHFLRAYYYYNLAIRFGEIPLVKTTIDPEKAPAKNTIDEVWTFIEEELETAATLLPEKSQLTPENIGRADRGAANSLLGIACLYQEKWQDAFDIFSDVIESGAYGLEPNFGDLFKPAFDNGIEVVFETQAKGGEDFSYSNGFLWMNSNLATHACGIPSSRKEISSPKRWPTFRSKLPGLRKRATAVVNMWSM